MVVVTEFAGQDKQLEVFVYAAPERKVLIGHAMQFADVPPIVP